MTEPSIAAVEAPVRTRNVFGLVALILAIVGFVVALLAPIALAAWLFTLPAFVLSIIGLTRKSRSKGTSVASLIVSTVAFILALVTFSTFWASQPKPPVAAAAAAAPTQSPASEAPQATPSKAPRETKAPEPKPVETFRELSEREFALLVKDPSSAKGQKLTIYGLVTQFDAASGKCSFLASTSNTRQEDSFDYLQNTVLVSGDGKEKCPLLNEVVEGDVLKLSVVGEGAQSYNTQAGGNTTAPLFEVVGLERL
jgi:hypothetical protein